MPRVSNRMQKIATRYTADGREINVIEDTHHEVFWVGIEMTINHDGKSTSEPNGCRTFYLREDSIEEADMMSLELW